jgi:hypothetical protein
MEGLDQRLERERLAQDSGDASLASPASQLGRGLRGHEDDDTPRVAAAQAVGGSQTVDVRRVVVQQRHRWLGAAEPLAGAGGDLDPVALLRQSLSDSPTDQLVAVHDEHGVSLRHPDLRHSWPPQ